MSKRWVTTERDFSNLLRNQDIDTISIHELADWRASVISPKLSLAPIQRSLVWTNAQVIAYWDSLLRGYPPGMMMVQRRGDGSDFELFDGQQRLNAILLGINPDDPDKAEVGRRLWIDVGAGPAGDLRFALRANTQGQPFGYKQAEPNSRFEIKLRRDKFQDERYKGRRPTEIFDEMRSKDRADLIGAGCAVALSAFLEAAHTDSPEITEILRGSGIDLTKSEVTEAIRAAKRALELRIVLLKLPAELTSDKDDYIRFFGRAGQGGTRLSDAELVYSIIKQRYPRVRDRIKEIVDDQHGAGRLIGDVDLVLAALRAARAISPDRDKSTEEGLARPTPQDVQKIHFDDPGDETARIFKELLPKSASGKLLVIMVHLRELLAHDKDANPLGLPRMLLARLDKNLIDVLVLWQVLGCQTSSEERDASVQFVLYWLIFVDRPDKAATHAFRVALEENWRLSRESLQGLISHLESQGAAWRLPSLEELERLTKQSDRREKQLRSWVDRFAEDDQSENRDANNVLRHWSTKRELVQRTLMWLQRDYLTTFDPHYDPTSDRDEDLPLELDHLVPSALWYHWGACNVDEPFRKRFRDNRSVVGDSMGNFRWLDASQNAGRGDRPLEADLPLPVDHHIADPKAWNDVIDISSNRWSGDRCADFQRLVELRTLDLFEKFLTESGIRRR